MADALRSDRFVLQKAHERGVSAVELWAVDPLGRAQVVSMPLDALDAVLEEGFAVSPEALGAAFEELGLDEIVLAPDPTTFAVLGRDTARFICDLRSVDGSPLPLCARSALKRSIGRATQLGSMFYAGATLQHQWLGNADAEHALTDARLVRSLARDTAKALESLGIAWRSHYLGRDGRFCLELDWVDPLTLADAVVTHRRVVHDLALDANVVASFAPFPWSGARSRLDLYLSLSRDGAAAFDDVLDPDGLAPAARAFIHALEAELGGLELLMRGTLASYPAPEPIVIARGPAGRGEGASVLMRGADASANPYTLLAVAVGLGAESSDAAAPASPAPARSLLEAAHRAAHSARLRDVLGHELIANLGET